MKYIDTLIILLAAAIFILLIELGYGNLIERFSVIIFMVAYYSGKAIARWQQRKLEQQA